jgi:flavin reductase (DIM6/NTAB) family NADH-FMN oxidoreductase RutF
MFYEPRLRNHGLRHDPFKALVVPRPIGWIGTLDANGRPNLAPYSFFNAISDRPPLVMFSSAGRKHSVSNIAETGEFTCSLASYAQRDQMNLSSAPVAAGVDEFELAGLEAAPSRLVKAPSVSGAPAALECRLWRIVDLPPPEGGRGEQHHLVIGEVVGIHVADAFVREGRVDTGSMRVLSRLGYMEYGVLEAATIFTMNRPQASADGQSAALSDAPWDGVYR